MAEQERINENSIKKVCAVHDISCAGRCSLTVILPVISSAGIETNVIPTAVLSTHTGEFSGYTFNNLEKDILPIAKHWNSLGRTYDAIYTGFFGSAEQIAIAKQLPGLLGKRSPEGEKEYLLLVDPVMADEGKMYTGFDLSFAGKMRDYVKSADIIVPNLTEASLLLGSEYKPGIHTPLELRNMAADLSELGPHTVVITGVSTEAESKGAVCFEKSSGKFSVGMRKNMPGRYYGTGDLFAAAFLAAILKNRSGEQSMNIALDLVYDSIEKTYKTGCDRRYGVEFEQYLGEFAEKCR